MGPLGGRRGFLSGTRRVPCRPRQGASVSPSSPPCPRLPRAGPGAVCSCLLGLGAFPDNCEVTAKRKEQPESSCRSLLAQERSPTLYSRFRSVSGVSLPLSRNSLCCQPFNCHVESELARGVQKDRGRRRGGAQPPGPCRPRGTAGVLRIAITRRRAINETRCSINTVNPSMASGRCPRGFLTRRRRRSTARPLTAPGTLTPGPRAEPPPPPLAPPSRDAARAAGRESPGP